MKGVPLCCCASVVCVFAAVAVALAGPMPVEPDVEGAVRAAIVSAVQARLGSAADVRIDDLRLDLASAPSRVVARLEPGALLGRVARFTIVAPSGGRGRTPAHVGTASATVRAFVPHARATHDLARGDTLAGADLARTVDEVVNVPVQRLPPLEALLGARVLRPVHAGEPITASAVGLAPLVRSGETVEGRVRVGAVDVVALLTASQTGSLGDAIQVVNPRGGRRLKARVSGPGRVEVMR